MKKLKLFSISLFVALTCASFASCSDDDNDLENGSLAGTSWTILSNIYDETGEEDDDEELELIGCTITFLKDGNVKFNPSVVWTYAKWTQDGNTLKLILGEGEPDDYMEGTFTINDKKATYKYSWYDCDGKWGGNSFYTMTLQKK